MMRVFLALICVCLFASLGKAQTQEQRLANVERMIESGTTDAALLEFADRNLAESYRSTFAGDDALLEHLRAIRTAVGPVGGVGLSVQNGVYRLVFSNRSHQSTVRVRVESGAPFGIVELAFEGKEAKGSGLKLGWANVEETLRRAEEEGFCGSVLIVKDGRTVIDQGYGFADPAKRHPVTPETMFAIGSTPIDFTHAGILKLEELGKVNLSDPLTKYFQEVPADKQQITLEHLRTSRSGLYNFPGIRGVDENMDLSWIDRAEFMNRVLQSELLFEPGTSRQHSHAAWGVLAAVIEIASGQDYESFLRDHFFEPAGMERTGHYPLTHKFDPSEVAVGLGGNTWGEVNSPQYWGETSWLVLGSGGMVSTPRDLRAWHEFLRSGKAFGPQAQRKYGVNGARDGIGGNDRGFVTTVASQGDDFAVLCSNSHAEMDDEAAQLGEALSALVLAESGDSGDSGRSGQSDQAATFAVDDDDDRPGDRSSVDGSPPPNSPRMQGVSRFDQLLGATEDDLDSVVDAVIAPRLTEKMGRDNLRGTIDQVREALSQAERVDMSPAGDYRVRMVYQSPEGRSTLFLRLEESPPHRISGFELLAEDG